MNQNQYESFEKKPAGEPVEHFNLPVPEIEHLTAARPEPMSLERDEMIRHIKMELNTLIWMHCREDLTLGQAEDLSLRMLDPILPEIRQYNA